MKFRPEDFFQNFNESKIEEFKNNNPKLWKKMMKRIETGHQIALIQQFNGLDRENEQRLRLYFHDYFDRYTKYGPNSFPNSYNVLEPFLKYNHHNSIIELLEEEEAYGVSLIDFLDFITEADFDLDKIDFHENILEETIYHFTFTTGVEEINFANTKGKTFIIGGLSLVRRGNEVSVLLQAGESYDKQKAVEHFEKLTREYLEKNISPYKKSLGYKLEYEGTPKVVHYLDRDDLWLHSIATLIDIESKSIDIRHVARDENISYSIISDDFQSTFRHNKSKTEEEVHTFITHTLDKLNKYDAVFDFAKYALALPYYVFENEDKLVDVMYETHLKDLIKGPLSKKEYKSVPYKYKTFAKPFYYLESPSQSIIKNKDLSDESFKVEKKGYWKRIAIDEEGFDKKGRKILGKTWVERSDVYYTTPKGITQAIRTETNSFEGKNVGYIYIMRQPIHEENIFKIGLTTREVEKRKRELSNTSNADKFFIIHRYYTKDCVIAEKLIHERLNKFRLSSRREFFRCDLKIILDTCEEIIKEINQDKV